MLVPNDSHMVTLSKSEPPIRLMMSEGAQWLCLLPPSSSIPPISVHLVVHLCRCRCSTSFPKEEGSLDQVDTFRTGSGSEKHSVLLVRQPEIALFPFLHAPLCRKFFARLALALASSNRIASRQSQSRQHWKARVPQTTPRLFQAACYRMPAMAMRSHRRGDACPVEHGVSSD